MRVINLRALPGMGYQRRLPDGAVRVDRGSPWGNPYRVGEWEVFDHFSADGKPTGKVSRERITRERAIELFEAYAETRLMDEPDWLEPLRGRDLACWCAPRSCHADILARLLQKGG